MRQQERDDDDDQHGIRHANSHRHQEGDDHAEVVDCQEGFHEKEELGHGGVAVPVRISFRIALTIAGRLVQIFSGA
jgi:ABC-type Zn2+ transport system substrate-binding protein/surface adhesin